MAIAKTPHMDFVQSENLNTSILTIWLSVKTSFWSHVPLYALGWTTLLTAFVISYIYDLEFDAENGSFFLRAAATFLISVCLFGVACKFVYLIISDRPKRPTLILAHWLWSFVVNGQRLVNGLHMMLAFIPFVIGFSYLKWTIPIVNPFSWDETFSLWDQFLHLGYHPWELLTPLFGNPIGTFFINLNYNLWFFVKFLFLFGFAFAARDSVKRQQFLIAFMLTWVLGGNAIATLLSSAGPAFYGKLGLLNDPYVDQMALLNTLNTQVEVWALPVQDILWRSYSGEGAFLAGISAMPSMHVAAAVLFVFAGFSLHRVLGWVMLVYAGIILIGSVHLAWHYAVDGYVSIITATFFWWISGKFARWYTARLVKA